MVGERIKVLGSKRVLLMSILWEASDQACLLSWKVDRRGREMGTRTSYNNLYVKVSYFTLSGYLISQLVSRVEWQNIGKNLKELGAERANVLV